MGKVVPISREITRRHERAERGELVHFDTPMEVVAFVGYEIRHARRKYVEIARAAGCCAATVSNMVNGYTKSPQLRTAMAILQVLGFEIVVRK